MTIAATEPNRPACCCSFDQVQTEGRTITVQGTCPGCPQHGYGHYGRQSAQAARERLGEPTEGDPA